MNAFLLEFHNIGIAPKILINSAVIEFQFKLW